MDLSENPLADLVERQSIKPKQKLSLADQCSYFATLKLGVSPAVVAEATGLTLQTVCNLRDAGEYRYGQLRYPKVANEYARLGHGEFIHRYINASIRDAIDAAVTRVNARERNPLNSRGYNPAANRMVGRHEWVHTSTGKHVIFRIELHHERGGYFWRDLKPYHEAPEVPSDQQGSHPGCQLHGDPERGPEEGPSALGFSRSNDCAKFVKRRFNPAKLEDWA